MLTPLELREQSQFYRNASAQETVPALRRRLASHALALAQLAERLEIEERSREPGMRDKRVS
jgi:hypothetical protein